ncbi:ECF transporter S component [Frisingicoccus caecimuris]|uniref:Energy-coupling factor transport system substrate-specific component n=1 Tax=Frisingicoccus caecimuris TaxID=1796636 RepID=A0A4V2SD99_9FIRM|nr:ECF transporter S component [Frisingicoccus caecimuris]MCR1919791.1 ECF transporter S component [Frisingicoccus caecimuris]TCO82552.1 energy-coupling factor transport system substrate-specific component [Frisingicoccus caecimuris]
MSDGRNFTTLKQCMVALGIVLNIVGAFIALNLRLPVYLDSIGTVLSGALLGPVYGVATGVLGSFISGITFDVYSLYYAPVQILTGLMAGWMFRTKWLRGYRLPIGGLALSLPTSIASAAITAFLFGGITSSGSSYLVVLMSKLGMNLTLSCFLVQVLTDYADKLIAVLLVAAVLKVLTPEMKMKIRGGRNGAL